MKHPLQTAGRRATGFFLCLFALLSFAAPCLAAESETRTVRVGFFAFDGYHEQNENGVRSGYGYEILQHLAGYGGFRYEYVGYDKSWNEMQDMLECGEIDLLTSAQKTPERMERFDFSEDSIGVSAAILTVKAGDPRFVQADYAGWNGIRVGMIEGNSRNDSFAAYAAEHGFAYTPVYFDSADAMIAELKSDAETKPIDAVLTSNLRHIKDEWILAQFAPSPFYIMVQKGNGALLDRVNSAISQLGISEPDIATTLMNKYYSADSGSEIAFTADERAYIQAVSGMAFSALVSPDHAPYSWAEDGKMTGILCDAARKIAARCGLHIAFPAIDSEEECAAAIRDGAAEIRFDAVLDYNKAEAEGYWLTGSYTQVPVARLHRENVYAYHTVAVIRNCDIAPDYVAELAEAGCEIVTYDSAAAAVTALMERKADMALMNIAAANRAAWEEPTSSLVADEISGVHTHYCVAVSQSCDPRLYAILCKAADSIEEDEDMSALVARYGNTGKKPLDFIGYCINHPLHAAIAIMAAIIIAALVVWLIRSAERRKKALLQKAEEQRQNELLKDALAAAEQASTAKSQFLSRVSHEMRTPLNAILGFIELAKGADKAQMEDYLASSDLAAKQLLNVINDVLDMSSIESGKLKIANAPFDFKRLITSITNIYGAQCKQKGVAFETKITTPTEDWLVGDELRVNQILMNLLGNAVKFTAEGHIILTVSETAVLGDKLFLRFAVSDTGCGMSEAMQSRLFHPFEQESASTARKYGGSGLGLSIVKNLVSMMGGTVRVESRQGVGTTFTVDLPFEKSQVVNDAVLTGKAEALRILAVDDEKMERDYISAVLGRMGVRYTCVASGSEALSALARSEAEGDLYNVCLLDWRMPDMDGIDTTKRIREKYGKEVVVIVASAYDFNQVWQGAKAVGADMFLSKPLFQSSLFDLLMSLTGGGIAKTGAKAEQQACDFAGRRVLLAEDNTLNQIVAKGYLAKYHVTVDVAENGRVAVDTFLAAPPGYYDAILMDIQMPVMDGFEATAAIRASAHPEAKTVQIIAQTADAFNEDIARALSCGMNAHVAKPIKPDVLAKALLKAFSEKRADGPTTANHKGGDAHDER